MDIVSRLKLFMEYSNIAISQFADTCKIPRPTMSQILNGRNKKISDELISKIHLAYPHLSVLWLMFGEGSMMADGNIRFSEGKKEANPNEGSGQTTQNERNNLFASSDIAPSETSLENNSDNSHERFNDYFIEPTEFATSQKAMNDSATATIDFMYNDPKIERNKKIDAQSDLEPANMQQPGIHSNQLESMTREADTSNTDEEKATCNQQRQKDFPQTSNISIPTSSNKRITNIVVFYSDNSFQSFAPTE